MAAGSLAAERPARSPAVRGPLRAEIYETSHVAPVQRASYFNERYRERFAQVTFKPTDAAGFQAELKVGALGLVDFACVRTDETQVERTKAHTKHVPDRLLAFILFVRGSGEFTHYGHVSQFSAGDVILCDNTEPSFCRYFGSAEFIVSRTTEAALRPRLPQFERLCGRLLPAGSGFADTAGGMARSLSEKLGRDLPPGSALSISGQLIDVFATAYAAAFGAAPETLAAARTLKAKEIIEARLGDPDLTPDMVARELGVSPRYLRLLIAAGGESVTGYILRRRLEECAKQLASELWRGRTITDVAFSWGFNSAAHFARVFKAKFGMTPREFRAQSIGS